MDGYLVIDTQLNTKTFDRQIAEVEYQLEQLDYELSKKKELNLDSRTIKEYETKAEKLNNQLVDLRKRQEKLNDKNTFGNIANSTEGIIKKITKWGLALFSIRSAYSFIRRSVSLLSESDEQLSTDIEYIRWALANSIKPIIEFIVSLVSGFLGVVGQLGKAIFGVNIFANSGAEAFKKQKDNLKGSNKEAKKLQKTLAGFDEINILQKQDKADTKTSLTPSFDLGTGGSEEFIEGMTTFLDEVFSFWDTEWYDFFNSFKGNWNSFFVGLGLTFKGFYTIISNIGKMLIGIFDMIIGVITGDFDLVKQGFDLLIDGIKEVLIGFFEMLTGLLLTILGAVKGLLLDIWDFFYAILIKPVIDGVATMWDLFVKGGELAWKGITTIFGGLATFFKNIFTDAWEGVKAVFSVGGKIFDGIKEGIVSVFTTIVNGIISGINKIVAIPFNALNGVLNFIKNIDLPLIGKPFYGFWDYDPIYVPQIPTIPLRTGGIVNYPNQGVPIAGESGREGIIPLTDSQAMEELGQEIGKNVVINATFPVYLGNRQVAREFRRIQAQESFATNR